MRRSSVIVAGVFFLFVGVTLFGATDFHRVNTSYSAKPVAEEVVEPEDDVLDASNVSGRSANTVHEIAAGETKVVWSFEILLFDRARFQTIRHETGWGLDRPVWSERLRRHVYVRTGDAYYYVVINRNARRMNAVSQVLGGVALSFGAILFGWGTKSQTER